MVPPALKPFALGFGSALLVLLVTSCVVAYRRPTPTQLIERAQALLDEADSEQTRIARRASHAGPAHPVRPPDPS